MERSAAINRERFHSFITKENDMQHDQAREIFNRKPFYMKKEDEAATSPSSSKVRSIKIKTPIV